MYLFILFSLRHQSFVSKHFVGNFLHTAASLSPCFFRIVSSTECSVLLIVYRAQCAVYSFVWYSVQTHYNAVQATTDACFFITPFATQPCVLSRGICTQYRVRCIAHTWRSIVQCESAAHITLQH